MRRARPKIAGLMGLIALAAIGLFAFRNVPDRWPEPAHCLGACMNILANHSTTLSFVVATLNLGATALALAGRGRSRRIALGFAAFGWGYLALAANVPWLDERFLAILQTPGCYAWMPGATACYPHTFFAAYISAAHSLLGIAAGLIGGMIALGLAWRTRGLARPTLRPTGPP